MYRNDYKYKCKMRLTEVQLRVWRYVECVECTGIEIELIGRVVE